MKRIFGIFLILGAILLIGFFLGPRPDNDIRITFDPASLPQDLDTYLADSESQVPNLTPGAEKEILWATPFSKKKTPVSIVYVHGFSASKHEIRPVPDKVAEALGANLYFTRMTGHGRDGVGMTDATASRWANDFAEAITIGERIGEKVFVIATSNGGAVTTWGVSQPELARRISGIALISPAYDLQGFPVWLANIPWAERIIPMIAGEERSWEPRNELQGKWWTTSYPSKAIFPMTSLLGVLKETEKSKISVPALFVYSPKDAVVVPDEISKVASQWGGKTDTLVLETTGDEYNHVIAGDILSPQTNQQVIDKLVSWFNALRQ